MQSKAGQIADVFASTSSEGGQKYVNVTCTPEFAPYRVLLGQPHTLSSQLEGLFISIFSISQSKGRRRDRGLIRGVLTDWAKLRLYQVAWGKLDATYASWVSGVVLACNFFLNNIFHTFPISSAPP